MKINGFEFSDDLIELARERWPLWYDAEHPDALGRMTNQSMNMDTRRAPFQVVNHYQGVLRCGSIVADPADPFAECGMRIVPDGLAGVLGHLTTCHGYRMDGLQYDNANVIVGKAADAQR